MTVVTITPGQPHPLGWVPTHLDAGDELGSFPGNIVPAASDLSKLYGTDPQTLVEGNGVVFDTAPINAWVLATGGSKLSNGEPVFTQASVIFLPPDGPRAAATVTPVIVDSGGNDVAKPQTGSGWGWFFGLLIVGGGGYYAYRQYRKKHPAPHHVSTPD